MIPENKCSVFHTGNSKTLGQCVQGSWEILILGDIHNLTRQGCEQSDLAGSAPSMKLDYMTQPTFFSYFMLVFYHTSYNLETPHIRKKVSNN